MHNKKGGLFLWTPPPAVADVAIEELLKARHKRTDTFHVVMIPCLMTLRWRRLLNKAAILLLLSHQAHLFGLLICLNHCGLA
jgi:hypothetical protein